MAQVKLSRIYRCPRSAIARLEAGSLISLPIACSIASTDRGGISKASMPITDNVAGAANAGEDRRCSGIKRLQQHRRQAILDGDVNMKASAKFIQIFRRSCRTGPTIVIQYETPAMVVATSSIWSTIGIRWTARVEESSDADHGRQLVRSIVCASSTPRAGAVNNAGTAVRRCRWTGGAACAGVP